MASHLALPALLAGTSVQCPDGSPPPCAAAPRGAVTAPAIDRNRIAILPFRVSSADSMLGEGVADLLATEFTGEGAPRAAHQGSVLRAWRRAGGGLREPLGQDQALRVARDLGAGQLIDGSLVGLGSRLTITASLMSVPGGTSRRVGPFTAPADSIESLVSRLAASLLAASGSQRTAESRSRLTDSPAAMSAYLTGLSLYRRGRYDEAVEAFGRAIDIDTLFAAAAAQILLANGWLGLTTPSVDLNRVRALGWASRDRLNARDRAIIVSAIGPRYPALTPVAEAIVARQTAVEQAPDNPEAWYMLADMYFHFGQHLGIDGAFARAEALFSRAIALDSSFAGPLAHLLELAIFRHDTTAARRYYGPWMAGEPTGLFAHTLRFHYLAERGTAADRRAALALIDSLSPAELAFASARAQEFQLDPVYLNAAMRLRTRPRSRTADSAGMQPWIMVLTNAGKRAEAARASDSLDRLGTEMNISIITALYADGDSATGARWAATLGSLVDGPEAAGGRTRRRQIESACTVGQWRARWGDTATVGRSLALLRSARIERDGSTPTAIAELCAAVIEAYLRPEAVDRLDSIMRTGPPPTLRALPHENLALARLLAARGETRRALDAARRFTPYLADGTARATSLKLEGDLAALVGDRAGAERAWRQYLFMRANPDPALIPQRDSVRAALGRLQ